MEADSDKELCIEAEETMATAHLCVAPLHVAQCHLGIDGMTARHTEDLEVCVIVPFIHLRW